MGARDKKILTQLQAETLDVFKRYVDRHGQSPTLEELAVALGVRLPTVVDRVRGLINKGYIVRTSRRWRNLQIADRSERLVQIPLVFSVGADNVSVFAEHEFGRLLEVQETLLNGHRDVFAVRVMGDSMRDAGIFNGSFVLAEEAQLTDVRSGERVIAIIGDMIVLKRIIKTPKAVILEPENDSGDYSPIVITGDRDDFQVIGRFIDVISVEDQGADDVQFIPEV